MQFRFFPAVTIIALAIFSIGRVATVPNPAAAAAPLTSGGLVCKTSEDDEDWLNGVTICGRPWGQLRGIRVSDD
ncbi:hypothetical protein BDZ91DRAFT_738324 [Kalaharituber pfeilii]|nr:hypothetical protein BDZ91DRAFT_738324 [Kalaharituber pfeilii]